MKTKLILFVLFSLSLSFCVPCEPKEKPKENRKVVIHRNNNNKEEGEIVVIDGCEYIYVWFGAGNGGGSITHKGNCKYCTERELARK